MIVSSFSWNVDVKPNTWYTSDRFVLLNQYTTAFWLRVNLDNTGLVKVRVYKDCPEKARATIQMVVNEAFNSPEIIDNWIDYCEFPLLRMNINAYNKDEDDSSDLISIPLGITCKRITLYDPLIPLPRTQFDCWKQFYLNPQFSDLLVIIDDKELPVHKLVLAAQSPVFSKMFTTDMKEATEDQIEFKHHEADIMEEMIEYFYTGDTNAKTDAAVALKMLRVAHKYDVKHLTSICELTLVRNLTAKNVLQMFDIAGNYELAELRKQTLGFAVIKRNEVLSSSNFEDIVSKQPRLMCQFIRLLNIECNRFEKQSKC